MIPIRSSLAYAILLSGLFATACTPTPPPGGDTTPPGFLEVLVRLEKPGDPNVRGEFNITLQDVTMENLPSDLIIHILATAGDSDSGITGIALATQADPITGNPQNLLSQCSGRRNSEIIGLLTGVLLPFALSSPPSPPPSIWKVDATADPIAATGCVIDNTKGAGPVNISGFIRLIATNGVGQTAQSGTFIFDYADVGSK